MADPLSVAASIIGILAATAKVAEIVQPYISNAKDAPKIALRVHTEVQRVQLVLELLKGFLQDLAASTLTSRASFVQVDHIVILFTDGVIIFSELESLVSPFKLSDDSNPQVGLRQRILWASKSNEISEVMARMQGFFSLLSTVLNIFQCRSDFAALEWRAELENQLSALLDSNQALATKVQGLEDSFAILSLAKSEPLHTIQRQDDTDNATTVSQHANTITNPALTDRLSALSTTSTIRLKKDLETSRVYRRVKRTQSLDTFSSSALGSTAWSVFSGLSLADVSIISAIALPLCVGDIEYAYSRDWGSDRSAASTRRPTSEYVFQRSKVISIPEESYLNKYNSEYWKKYYPPLPSPKLPRTPPEMAMHHHTSSRPSESQPHIPSPSTPSASEEAQLLQQSQKQQLPVVHKYLRAFYPFQPISTVQEDFNGERTITPPLKKGDVIMVHYSHPSGWVDGHLLASGIRGWLPSNYCEPYNDPRMDCILDALAHIYDAIVIDKESGTVLSFKRSSLWDLGVGVRSFLKATQYLKKDSPLIVSNAYLRGLRKGMIRDLSFVLKTNAVTVVDMEQLDKVLLRTFKLATRAVRFLDIWTQDDAPGSPTKTTSSTTLEDVG